MSEQQKHETSTPTRVQPQDLGYNTPPGLARLQERQNPDNLSLFSESQLHPGVIGGARSKTSDIVRTSVETEKQEQRLPERRMDYTEHLGLTDLAERTTSSER